MQDESKRKKVSNFSKLETLTGAALMTMPLPPTRMIVENLIPQGLHIFGGAPKIGKSWLTLWLCLRITQGEPVWNLPTEKGNTLYLCLEDSFARVQNRLLDFTEDAPDTIHFATMSETIAGGLVKQIEDFLAEHPQTNFIAIDNLQRVRDTAGEANAYANDYREVNALKSLADKHRIAILLIHHLRKQADDDPLNMISGTTGLTGAVDGIYVLKKDKRTGNTAKFIATGRDIEQRELTLEFDRDSHLWNLVSDDTEHTSSPAGAALTVVKNYLQREEIFIGSATELAEQLCTKTPPAVLSKTLMQNQHALAAQGIQYSHSRTGNRREITLCVTVLTQLNQVLAAVFQADEFLEWAARGNSDTSEADKKAIAKLIQRDHQLRVLTRRVFEQNASGAITDETFTELYGGYQAEQKVIAAKIATLEAKLRD